MPRPPLKKYETIISLLASGLRTADIARRIGITRRALYDMMKTPEFRELYKSVQAELLSGAKDVMISGAIDAAKVIHDICTDDRYEIRDRLVAAKFLAETAKVFLERVEKQEKEDADELIPDWERGDDE